MIYKVLGVVFRLVRGLLGRPPGSFVDEHDPQRNELYVNGVAQFEAPYSDEMFLDANEYIWYYNL